MRQIYRLKDPLRVIQEQSRPIYWFPLVDVSSQGFVYLLAILCSLILVVVLASFPLGGCCACFP